MMSNAPTKRDSRNLRERFIRQSALLPVIASISMTLIASSAAISCPHSLHLNASSDNCMSSSHRGQETRSSTTTLLTRLILVRDFRAHRSGGRSFNRVEARIGVSIIWSKCIALQKTAVVLSPWTPTACDIQHKMRLSTPSFGLTHISAV
jgi:hypothetical protein